ncbi:hypothetical protein MLD38_007680 [Melastoma candidum]|uniref:Uncharacterized protein n=1 Tax=Melastoma candidum TaxID=119954 RepID=A0ACB9RUW6_9MYRT|nr:hypothetical protein MLD38_007680 [Melastoma candidum]
MALPRKVLMKKAQRFESRELQKNQIAPEHLSDLDELLNNVYATNRPTLGDYTNRVDIIRVFNVMAKEIYGKMDPPVVKGFGSFIMDLYSSGSDLDLSINFEISESFPREKQMETLRKFTRKLYSLRRKGHVSNIQPIMHARVPIVKFMDAGTKIECDLSVQNLDGILKSRLIHMISAIDERFQKLSFLMKIWAKVNGINSSKDKTLNSLSLISLVAFHLQTRNPPILPPFSCLFEDGTELAAIEKKVNGFLNYGKENKESLGFLFATLLIKLISVKNLWAKGLCASIYQGSWISKKLDPHCGFINVEDFTDRSENVSRAVGKREIQRISDLLSCSICALVSFLGGMLPMPQLKHLLFDPKSCPRAIKDEAENLTGTRTVVPYSSRNVSSCQVKKRLRNGNTRGKQATDPWEARVERKNPQSNPWEERKNQVDQHSRDSWNGWGANNKLKKYKLSYCAASGSCQAQKLTWEDKIVLSKYVPSPACQPGVTRSFNPSPQQRQGHQPILGSSSNFDSSHANSSAAGWSSWPSLSLANSSAAGWPSRPSLSSLLNRR